MLPLRPIPEPSYLPVRYLTRPEMTLIIGSRCSDGVVLVSDRMVTGDGGGRREFRDKLAYNVDSVVWGAAGNMAYFESFRTRVRNRLQERGIVSPSQFLPLVEEVHAELLRIYGGNVAGDLDVLIAEQIEDKSELHYVGAFGGHIPITEYDTIGRGRPYGSLFLDLLWKPDMTMKQVAELGYFVIALVERHFLDATIGIGDGHPQVFFIPDHHRVIRLASEPELDSMRKSKTKRRTPTME